MEKHAKPRWATSSPSKIRPFQILVARSCLATTQLELQWVLCSSLLCSQRVESIIVKLHNGGRSFLSRHPAGDAPDGLSIEASCPEMSTQLFL